MPTSYPRALDHVVAPGTQKALDLERLHAVDVDARAAR